MNSRSFLLARRRVASAWFAPGACVAAVIAAMTLAACGPRDATAVAGGAPGATPAVASTLPAQTSAAVDPALRTSGQPVPSTSGQVVAPTPAPADAPPRQVASTTTYAAAPGTTYPADPAPQGRPESAPPPVASNRVGSIASIEPIRTRPKGSGAGAVIGGVLGAVVGNQFGHGVGRAALTGAGAVGGAVAGNNVERNYKEGVSSYRVVIRLDNGHTRTFTRAQIGDLHVGERVRLDANSFHRG